MAYLVKQISNIVNDAVSDALGKNFGVKKIETSDFVSMGKAIDDYDLYEGFFGALVNRIAKTVYFVRSYEGSRRSILRDEQEYGAFIQKVYYDLPEAVENATWSIPNGEGVYAQASPYDVENTVAVSSLIFGGKGTWAIEIVRPLVQIKGAFQNEAAMMAFIDGIYVAIENAYKLEEESLVADAANTAMAAALDAGKARNLLAEYNEKFTQSLTVDTAMISADFLRYAAKEINRTVENMGKMSTAFNKAGYATFTTKENLVVEMLTEFASAEDTYLQSDTFHNELTALPNYESVPYWQSSGRNFDFADCSAINIEHDDLNADVSQDGIIAFVHDVENVAAYFGDRRSWELPNPRSEVMIHGEKAEKGFAVDGHANGIVFYLGTSGTLTISEFANGTASADSSVIYRGKNNIITVVPTSGYHVKSIVDGGGAALTKVDTNVYAYVPFSDADATITITMEADS